MRLTVLNGVALLLVVVAFAVAAYAAQMQAMQRDLDDSLATQAREFNAALRVEFDLFRRLARVSMPDLSVFAASVYFIQVTNEDGEIVGRSRNMEEATLPSDAEMLRAALDGQQWFADVLVEGQPLRQFVAPLRVSLPAGDTLNVGMIQFARPLGTAYNMQRTLQATFFGVGSLAVLASLAVGWLLARAALRPIERLATTAHEIGSAQDFGRRVPVRARARDEVGRLAMEFNEMLGRLQAAYQQTEASLAAQRRFVADASHELRTPLTSLRGNVDFLRRILTNRGTPPSLEVQEQLLADLESETDRIARLVGDLLVLAQADAGQHLALQPTPLVRVVEDAFRSARYLGNDVDLTLHTRVDGEVWVNGDADRLRQLLLILLDNALKYTPEGGQVELSTELAHRAERPGVRLRVKDNGQGIPPGDLGRIFERFYRSDTARTAGGAGLGLAIAQWIVDEHRGQVEVESQEGRGTTIKVWLPIIQVPEADRVPTAEAPATSTRRGWDRSLVRLHRRGR